jgi:hypothetical protein
MFSRHILSYEEKKVTVKKMTSVQVGQVRSFFLYPLQWNWRNIPNNSWIAQAKDQEDCDVYAAFKAESIIESNLNLAEWRRGRNGIC